MTSRAAAAELSLACASQIRTSLASLKRDVALSFRICSRDFGVLGNELVHALATTRDRERAAALALEYERTARRRAQAKAIELQGAVRVLCRVRLPLGDEDALASPVRVASAQDVHVLVPSSSLLTSSSVLSNGDGTTTKSFSFDRVYGDDGTQQQLFKEIQPLVVAAVEGQHACVFAYGQTGAGKTTTIHGTENDRGLVYRAAETMFDLVHEQQHVFDFNVTVQMVEIYNEEMYDLLGAEAAGSSPGSTTSSSSYSMLMPFQTNPTGTHGPAFVSRRPLGEIRHGERGVYLRNVEAVAVHSAEDVLGVVQHGEVNRTVQSDDSDHSSRAHCVIMIDIQRVSHVDGQIDGGRFVLVDLAGSERLIRTESSGSHQRLREAQHINKSLAAIGDVLSALLAKDKHVPFRNSKLTHLLQESLSAADAQTLVVAHISPSAEHVSETINTLKFAARVNHQQHASKRRSERHETSRLQGVIATQTAQLQALQDKLASELELRRKYEKRLEEYRQEDHRRRAKDEDRGRSTPSKQSQGPSTPSKGLGPPSHQHATVSSSRLQATPEPRRWSLYGRKEPLKPPSASHTPRLHKASAGGQENISENIMRGRSPAVPTMPSVPEKSTAAVATPVRRARRLSVMMNSERKAATSTRSPLRVPTTHIGAKRPPSTPSEVRSILKKQRLSLEPRQIPPPSDTVAMPSGSKQVSFDLSSGIAARTVPTVGGVPPLSTASTSAGLPPRQPMSMLRTPMVGGRASAPPVRVAIRTPVHSGIASPMTRVTRTSMSPSFNKPKWNAAGWR